MYCEVVLEAAARSPRQQCHLAPVYEFMLCLEAWTMQLWHRLDVYTTVLVAPLIAPPPLVLMPACSCVR